MFICGFTIQNGRRETYFGRTIDNLSIMKFCSKPGDSGGPLVTGEEVRGGNFAVGIVVASTDACASAGQFGSAPSPITAVIPISFILNNLHVNLAPVYWWFINDVIWNRRFNELPCAASREVHDLAHRPSHLRAAGRVAPARGGAQEAGRLWLIARPKMRAKAMRNHIAQQRNQAIGWNFCKAARLLSCFMSDQILANSCMRKKFAKKWRKDRVNA